MGTLEVGVGAQESPGAPTVLTSLCWWVVVVVQILIPALKRQRQLNLLSLRPVYRVRSSSAKAYTEKPRLKKREEILFLIDCIHTLC